MPELRGFGSLECLLAIDFDELNCPLLRYGLAVFPLGNSLPLYAQNLRQLFFIASQLYSLCFVDEHCITS